MRGTIIKTIRHDERDFWFQFAESLANPANYRPGIVAGYPELRPDRRKNFTIRLNNGAYEIVPTDKMKRLPLHERAIKLAHTKHQSTSYCNPEEGFTPPVFGYDRDRHTVLVGVSFALKDCIFQRILSYDSGTVHRPYDFNTREEAEAFLKDKLKNKRWHTLFSDLKTYTVGTINEVMAGLKWTECSSVVIFTDNPKSRLLAILRAEDLKIRLKKHGKEFAHIPITFYPEFTSYTPAEQHADLSKYEDSLELARYVIAIKLLKNENIASLCYVKTLSFVDFSLIPKESEGIRTFLKEIPKKGYELLEALATTPIEYSSIHKNMHHLLNNFSSHEFKMLFENFFDHAGINSGWILVTALYNFSLISYHDTVIITQILNLLLRLPNTILIELFQNLHQTPISEMTRGDTHCLSNHRKRWFFYAIFELLLKLPSNTLTDEIYTKIKKLFHQELKDFIKEFFERNTIETCEEAFHFNGALGKLIDQTDSFFGFFKTGTRKLITDLLDQKKGLAASKKKKELATSQSRRKSKTNQLSYSGPVVRR